jgi:hypothetical protein
VVWDKYSVDGVRQLEPAPRTKDSMSMGIGIGTVWPTTDGLQVAMAAVRGLDRVCASYFTSGQPTVADSTALPLRNARRALNRGTKHDRPTGRHGSSSSATVAALRSPDRTKKNAHRR